MARQASAKYKKNKEKIKKKSIVKAIKILLKKKKTKIEKMFVNPMRSFQKVKNKYWLSIEENIMK